jgi:hydrogenase maturation factor
LLIILQATAAEKVLTRLRSRGIVATVIGKVTNKREGVKLLTADGLSDLPLYEQDELTKI